MSPALVVFSVAGLVALLSLVSERRLRGWGWQPWWTWLAWFLCWTAAGWLRAHDVAYALEGGFAFSGVATLTQTEWGRAISADRRSFIIGNGLFGALLIAWFFDLPLSPLLGLGIGVGTQIYLAFVLRRRLGTWPRLRSRQA